MRGFERDLEARREAAQAWGVFQNGTSGDAAVADARLGLALKSANAPTAAAVGGAEAFSRRYGLAPQGQAGATVIAATPTTQARVIQYAQQAQFVAGKTFFQSENGWID